MRDIRFIAEHRGGPLKKEQHKQLIRWACDCVKHSLPLLNGNIDERLLRALKIAEKWENDEVTVGDARNAAFGAIATARESQNPTEIAIARATGHAVATAHMADHAPGASEYILKAIIYEGKSVEEERKWQDEQLPAEIRELVISARYNKSKTWNTSFQKARKEMKNKSILK